MIKGHEAKIASMAIDTPKFIVEREQLFDFVFTLFWSFYIFLSSLSPVIAGSFAILKETKFFDL